MTDQAERFLCPRRDEFGGAGVFKLLDGEDHWRTNPSDGCLGAGQRACSFCGSAHPDDLFAAIEAGTELAPTDKDYKVYIGSAHKFYFQHLATEQKKTFVALLNTQAIKLAHPGHFYVLPFFMRKGPR